VNKVTVRLVEEGRSKKKEKRGNGPSSRANGKEGAKKIREKTQQKETE